MGQWREQQTQERLSGYHGSPEDSGEWPVLREPRETKAALLCKRALWFAVIYALLAGAVLLVAMLAGCAASPAREAGWFAVLRVSYANGQPITQASAGGGHPRAAQPDSRAEEPDRRGKGANSQDAVRHGNGGAR